VIVHPGHPSPHFQQHHDVAPPDISAARFRPAWLVKSRLLQLRDNDLITEPQLDAACAFRRDYDRAHNQADALVGRYTPRTDGSAVNAPELRLQLDALKRLRETEAALGRTRTLLLVRLVVHDDTFRALGRVLDIDDATAKRRAAEAVYALHCHQSGVAVPLFKATRNYRQPTRW